MLESQGNIIIPQQLQRREKAHEGCLGRESMIYCGDQKAKLLQWLADKRL